MNVWQHTEGKGFAKVRAAMKEAWDAGVWCFVVTKDEIVALEKPIIHEQRGQFHRETGPAIVWPGERYYFYRGVHIRDSYVIERPETITIADIDGERNQEVKRVKIELYGYERFMKDGGATKVAEDATGILWHRPLPEAVRVVAVSSGTSLMERMADQVFRRVNRLTSDDTITFPGEVLAMVEVVNGSPEPDGTFKHYWLRVPPNVRTPKEAVAWTYRLREDEYNPVIRT